MRKKLAALIILLSLASSLGATEVSAGPWALQTDLGQSEASSMLSSLSFQLDPSNDSHWLVSSGTLLLSDAQGNLVPNISLYSSCLSSTCHSSADIYRSEGGRIAKVGRLQSKSGSLFTPPSQSASESQNTAALINESQTPLASLMPISLPPQWLWAAAIVIVLLITLAFLMRNRD
jgi:hypothetical protein